MGACEGDTPRYGGADSTGSHEYYDIFLLLGHDDPFPAFAFDGDNFRGRITY